MQVNKGYKFSDVLMVPRYSTVPSRDTPSLKVTCGKQYTLPFMASPMRGIVGVRLIKELSRLGGIGFLHRFWRDQDEYRKALDELKGTTYGISLGLDLENLKYAKNATMILIDVANGYLDKTLKAVDKVKETYPNKIIVAGNVVTRQGARALHNWGADLVRCGIGNGSQCLTRDVVGVGYPQLTAIEECSEVAPVIADGGMKTSGDMAKALAAGASFCMLGGPLATAKESTNTGIIYGMASARLHIEMGKPIKSVEGTESCVKVTDSLENILNRFAYGIKSSMTYMNATTLEELRENVSWVTS